MLLLKINHVPTLSSGSSPVITANIICGLHNMCIVILGLGVHRHDLNYLNDLSLGLQAAGSLLKPSNAFIKEPILVQSVDEGEVFFVIFTQPN